MDQHKLHDKVCNDAVYANDRLVEHLGECGYKPVPRMAGLWKHETRKLTVIHALAVWTTLASNVKTKIDNVRMQILL